MFLLARSRISSGFGGFSFNDVGSLNLDGATPNVGIDADGDGVVDTPEIVVTAQFTAFQATVADSIASGDTAFTFAALGYLAGGLGMANALRALGLSPEVAAGVTGSAGALGATTSVSTALNAIYDDVYQATFNNIARDVVSNPSKYENYLLLHDGSLYDMNYFDN